MAITGSWAERARIQAGAAQLGSGWNPIHAHPDSYGGRNTAPGGSEPVTEELTDKDYGYTEEDSSSVLFGFGSNTGTADRPALGEEMGARRAVTPEFPHWGNYQNGVPGGGHIRSLDHGADSTYTMRDPFLTDAYAGWDNKLHGEINDAVVSDPSQYIMNTSMVQRDQTLQGSQRSGSQSPYSAPIHSRIPGMKAKPFAGAQSRHLDMLPREQTFHIRPWWSRNAGTGPTSYMKSNDAYTSTPLTRNPPSEPYQGPILANDSGYTDEDLGVYY